MLAQAYSSILQNLSKSLTLSFSVTKFIEILGPKISESMEINRVGIWRYNEQGENLVCDYLFDRDANSVDKGLIIYDCQFPSYFKEIKSERLIDAENARTDIRTKEFTESYLVPLSIFALLDIPIFMNGALLGVICLENRRIRKWSTEDKLFVRSIADLCTVAYIQEDLRTAIATIEAQKNSIERANDTLECKVLERTAELERRNELLSEYAFINSHLLRGPICTMRGLVNLLSMDEISNEERVLLLDKLNLPIDRLNEFCDNITNALHKGYFISREEIR